MAGGNAVGSPVEAVTGRVARPTHCEATPPCPTPTPGGQMEAAASQGIAQFLRHPGQVWPAGRRDLGPSKRPRPWPDSHRPPCSSSGPCPWPLLQAASQVSGQPSLRNGWACASPLLSGCSSPGEGKGRVGEWGLPGHLASGPGSSPVSEYPRNTSGRAGTPLLPELSSAKGLAESLLLGFGWGLGGVGAVGHRVLMQSSP